MEFNQLRREGIIRNLAEIEKETYLEFHRNNYEEDKDMSFKFMELSPKWAIVAGYYALHNLAKLFLAKKYSLRISGKFVHSATIEALKHCFKEKRTLDKLIRLLEKAKEKYNSLNLDINAEEILPAILKDAKKERTKAQYYTHRLLTSKITKQEAESFYKDVVKPFIELIEAL